MSRRFWPRYERAVLGCLALSLALTLTACYSRPHASATGRVYVMKEPPPRLDRSRLARPSAAAVWIPGQWRWNGYRYAWLPGYWELQPHGAWVPGYWEHTPRGWVWMYGSW